MGLFVVWINIKLDIKKMLNKTSKKMGETANKTPEYIK